MSLDSLVSAVRGFAPAALQIDEIILNNPAWHYEPYPAYSDVRYALLHTTLELRQLAVQLHAARQQAGAPLTPAQYALAQHHAAFRDFEALLLAFDAEHFSAEPAQGEWSAAVILAHVHQVERNFYAAILNTIRNPAPGFLSDEEVATLTGEPADIVPATELAAGWAAFARLHARLQAELAALTDAQLTMPSPYWEPEPWPTIGFRLHRFESHLREHTNQLEKSLAMLGIKRNEGQMLVRQMMAALAEVEGLHIGVADLSHAAVDAAAAQIAARFAALPQRIEAITAMIDAVTALDHERIAGLVGAEPVLAATTLPDGRSAILFAKYNGRADIVQTLLASGLRLNLAEAAAVGESDRVRRILEAWPDAANHYSSDGFTPLQLACFFGYPDSARLLIDAGADVLAVARNSMQIQPIHAAVAGRNADIVRMLIAAGADVNARQQDDFTPLATARQNEDRAIEEMLVAAGAK